MNVAVVKHIPIIQTSPRLASLHIFGFIIEVAQAIFSTTEMPVRTDLRML